MERKLATIRVISNLSPIEGADLIEKATVDGWSVVVKKGLHNVGDKIIYCEIDSWIPTAIDPLLSKGNTPREYNGVSGERLRSIRLRKTLSQGLIVPLSVLPNGDYNIGDDVSAILNIQKWEDPDLMKLTGDQAGKFPSFIPKTDQERIQNCFTDVIECNDNYEVTMKIDGSSTTIFNVDGVIRVASRNWELKINDENKTNPFVQQALKLQNQIPEGFAIQGELYGTNICGNKEQINGHEFAVFDVFNFKEGKYLMPKERREFCKIHNLPHVPVLNESLNVNDLTVDEILALADGPSIKAKVREGIVFKSNTNDEFSFKAISNKWLLKHNE